MDTKVDSKGTVVDGPDSSVDSKGTVVDGLDSRTIVTTGAVTSEGRVVDAAVVVVGRVDVIIDMTDPEGRDDSGKAGIVETEVANAARHSKEVNNKIKFFFISKLLPNHIKKTILQVIIRKT